MNSSFDKTDLKSISRYEDLRSIAEELDINVSPEMKDSEILIDIVRKIQKTEQIKCSGVLDILKDGYGFLRDMNNNYNINIDDAYIAMSQIKKLHLRNGDTIEGIINEHKPKDKHFNIKKITKINGKDISTAYNRPNFDKFTADYAREKFDLCDITDPSCTGRLIDIVSPIGRGQRALIVAPPRSGKTVILQKIAASIETNHPDVELMMLLIDERPEEVTEMKSKIKSTIISSTFDEPGDKHVKVAEITIERAKRLVESGKDVVILLDSITRLARAYNTILPSSGKLLTGGVDANSLRKPKRFFGAARNCSEGGSLTIIGTALVDTGSKMDEVIFEEFKGTGNAEIVLSREIAENRIFPAIDIKKCGTRKEEYLIEPDVQAKTFVIRKLLASMTTLNSISFLLEKIKKTKNNAAFFDSIGKITT